MRKITWLHLSDIHYQIDAGYENYNRRVVLNALLQDIRLRAENTDPELSKLDFIVLTGDIAYSGKKEQYAGFAEEFLAPLVEAAGFQRRDFGRIFIVPGNHDIDREAIAGDVQKLRTNLVTRDEINQVLLDSKHQDILINPQRAYFDFFAKQFPSMEINQCGGFYVAQFSTSAGVGVSILGLNSAWLSEGSDSDRANLAVGEIQVDGAIKLTESADVRLALLHHPLDWLKDSENATTTLLLNRYCQFVLHGHLHVPNVVTRHSLYGDVLVIPSGSVYGSREWPNGYNYSSIDLDSGKTTIHLRRWNDDRREWQRDTMSTGDGFGGKIVLPSPSTLLLNNNSRSVIDQITGAMKSKMPTARGRWRRIDGLRPSVDPSRTIGRAATVRHLRGCLEKQDAVSVVGLPGVGKSTVVSMYASLVEQEALSANQTLSVVWLNLNEEIDLSDIVGTVLDEVGAEMLNIAEHSSASLARVLVEVLRERSILLVLDQTDNLLGIKSEQRAPWADILLTALLEGVEPSKVVVINSSTIETTRGICLPAFDVQGLSQDDAVSLLLQLGAAGSKESMYIAAHRTAGHPLAMTLVAQRAKQVGSLDLLVSDHTLWHGHGEEMADHILGSIFDSGLDANEQKMLSALSILRGPSPVELVAIAMGLQPPVPDFLPQATSRLVSKMLINSKANLYWLHPVVRTYVQSKLADPQSIHSRLASFFGGMAYFAKKNPEEYLAWALESLYHSTKAGDSKRAVRLLVDVAGPLFDSGLYHVVGFLIGQVVPKSQSATKLSDEENSQILTILGRFLRHTGKLDQAIATYERALLHATRASDEKGMAWIITNLSAALLARKRYKEAVQRSTEAVRLARKVGNRLGEASALGNLGIGLRDLGKSDEAERRLREALQIQKELDDARGQVVQMNTLGIMYRERSDILTADTWFQQALEVAESRDLPLLKAMVLTNVGVMFSMMKMPSWAIQRYRDALRIWRSLPIGQRALVFEGVDQALLAFAQTYLEVLRPKASLVCMMVAKNILATRSNWDRETEKHVQEMLDFVKSTWGCDKLTEFIEEIKPRIMEELDALLNEPGPKIGLMLLAKRADGAELENLEVPDDARFWNDGATAFIEDPRNDEDLITAEGLLRAAIDRMPDLLESYVNLGNLLARKNNAGEAEWFLRQAVKLDADNADALISLGLFLAHHNRWMESVAYLRSASEKRPEETRVFELLGLSLMRTEQWQEASEVYRTLLEMEPENQAHRLELGVSLRNAGDYAQAQRCIEAVIREDPTNIRGLVELGFILGETDRAQDAISMLLNALKGSIIDPASEAKIKETLGLCYYRLGQLDNAERALRQACSVDSKYSGALYNLGVVLTDKGRNKDAEKAYCQCLRLDESCWRAHVNLSHLLMLRGDLQGARRHCGLVLTIKPDCKEALENFREIEAGEVGLASRTQPQTKAIQDKRKGRARKRKRRRKGR